MDPAHPLRAAGGPGMLHVPDQHAQYDEAAGMHTSAGWVTQSTAVAYPPPLFKVRSLMIFGNSAT